MGCRGRVQAVGETVSSVFDFYSGLLAFNLDGLSALYPTVARRPAQIWAGAPAPIGALSMQRWRWPNRALGH